MDKLEQLNQEALELIKSDKEIFVRCCEELDSYMGFINDIRLYDMEYELDELHYGMKLSDFLERVDFSEFNFSDKYWYYNAYGNLCSYNGSKYDFYNDNVWTTDILENLINYYGQIDLAWIDSTLDDAIRAIVEYDEDEEQE